MILFQLRLLYFCSMCSFYGVLSSRVFILVFISNFCSIVFSTLSMLHLRSLCANNTSYLIIYHFCSRKLLLLMESYLPSAVATMADYKTIWICQSLSQSVSRQNELDNVHYTLQYSADLHQTGNQSRFAWYVVGLLLSVAVGNN